MIKNLVWLVASYCLGLPLHAGPPDLAQSLAGAWTGSLQYRDFSNDKQVVLPATVTFSGPSTALRGDYVYDDGPGKKVKSTEQWALAPDGATLRTDATSIPARVTLYRVGAGADVTLEAEGTGEENKQAVAVRTQLERQGDALTITRLTQLPDQPWRTRHTYRFVKPE
jgi:hypothetical protein